LLVVPLLAGAAEILDSSVELEAGTYRITVDARIDAPRETVLRLITDYEHLSRINSSIEETRVLQTNGPDSHRVHTVIRACILFFCKRVTQLQDITRYGNDSVEAVILPEGSDFRHGIARWELTSDGRATRMHFTAELEPAFWVPPLIGPWLFERKIVREIRESARYMERDAQQRKRG
jgi:hypothetical protein